MTGPIERPAIYPLLAPLAGDLAQPTGGSSPPGLGIGTATLLSWDAGTLSGTFDYRGTILQGIPVLSALDAFSWTTGDEILLLTWHPTDGHRRKGIGSYFAVGRVFRPSSANSEKVLQALQNQFASQVAVEIFADRIFANDVNATETVGSTSYGNLATTGPTVSDVSVTNGKAIVFVSARINLNAVNVSGGSSSLEGFANFEVSGATSISPVDTNAAYRNMNLSTHNGANPHTINESTSITRITLLDVLNNGIHTFQMKYKRSAVAGGSSVTIGARTLVVIAF